MYHLTCAPSEDTRQLAHPRSSIHVFAVRSLNGQGMLIF